MASKYPVHLTSYISYSEYDSTRCDGKLKNTASYK